MCITVVLIPLVIWKVTPKIKMIRGEIDRLDQRIEELLQLAYTQMAPLNGLFGDRDALNLIEKTIPSLSFAPAFTAEQEGNMILNYDFSERAGEAQSTVDVLSGTYNKNPFLFEQKLVHTMGVETYHGYRTISWTETYRGSDGKTHTRTRTQTLHASLTKPKPYFETQVSLSYCTQGGPDLSFSRDATYLNEKSDREIERYVKRGEKRLDKKTDEAIKKNEDFMSMSNTDFEVLFDALDRTHEVQFRTLFTPLAQTNMVDLILSDNGFGDDFNFIKTKRTNKIISKHSQGRGVNLLRGAYPSYSFDIIKENFILKNTAFFKMVYFDFAPLWAIPLYQEEPVHSLHPIPDYERKYSIREYEALSNSMSRGHVVHPNTQTEAILTTSYVRTHGDADEISVSAFSYDIIPRVDFVRVLGGDGHWHSVSVHWNEYIPLEATNHFFVSKIESADNQAALGVRNDLCIYT